MTSGWRMALREFRLPLGAGLTFAVLNAFLVSKEWFFLPLIPCALGVLLLGVFALDKLLYLISFLTPLSLILEDSGLGATLSLPSEALLVLASGLLLLKIWLDKPYPLAALRHPVTVVLLAGLAWAFFTSLTSTMPLVSFKNFAARMWFILPCYFLGLMLFRQPGAVHRFVWLHLAGLMAVILYTTYRHFLWNFEKDPAHWVMTPFYNDHTAYGMILAFFLPFAIHFAFNYPMGLFFRICAVGFVGILWVAFRLSNSRAAWLSLAVAGVFWILIRFRVRWYVVTFFAVLLAALMWSLRVEIQQKLARTKEQSSERLDEQIRSITNITTDPSNLERFNRWKSALRMAEDKPWLGFGPGTYQFQYAPYQSFLDLTIISTNAGNQGTAHSEYLLALSEQGWPGLCLWLASVFLIFITANHTYNKLAEPYQKNLLLSLLLGLFTYWTHAFLNNFLDTDKAAVPYFATVAAIVAADLSWKKRHPLPS